MLRLWRGDLLITTSLRSHFLPRDLINPSQNGKVMAGFDFIDGDNRLDQPADIENDSCRAHANMYLEHLPSKGKCIAIEPESTSSNLHDATERTQCEAL
ncbi:hypothetical protein Tco_0719389 [Tanacetum coccineum]